MIDNTKGTSSSYTYPNIGDNSQNYSEYCFNRLPCGLCRLTNEKCPKVRDGTPTITWTNITCEAKEK